MRKETGYWLVGGGLFGALIYSLLKRRSHPVPDHPFLDLPRPIVMAHRGGMGLYPPNTLYAFEHALELGSDVLEMDIHQSADGEIIVRHDPTVDATTNGSGAIKDLSLEQIRSLDAGYTWKEDGGSSYPYRGQGITIPTLGEVLAAFPQARLNIDIKPDDPEVLVPFVHLLHKHNALDRVLVASFHDRQLRTFRRLCPQVATAAGVNETRNFYILNQLGLGAIYQPRAQAFQPPEATRRQRIVSERFVRGSHAHNMQVHVWTVNAEEDMERLLSWGVDGIISDYPDRLLKLINRNVGEIDKENDQQISNQS